MSNCKEERSMDKFFETLKRFSKDESPASKYRNWFLNNGKYFDVVNESLSIQLAEKMNCEVKMCYNNCAKAIMNDYKNQYKFIEGYVETHGVPIEHAWIVKTYDDLELPEIVIDITLGISNEKRNEFGKERGMDYEETKPREFPDEYFGIELPKDYLMKYIFKHDGKIPTLFDYFDEVENK